MQSRKMTGRRRMGKGMRNGAGAKVITLMMILALLFSGIIGEVYAKDHEYSSVTSMTGGGDFQVGDRFQVRVSYTNGNGQNIAGMMARIAFPRRVLAYESTTLGPGSIDGYPEGYGSNLQNADRINQNGVFTLGLYNRDTVPALSATITFVAIAEGEGEITSTIGTYERAGWVDEDGEPYFLRGSSGSISFKVEKEKPGGNGSQDEDPDSDEEDHGDEQEDKERDGEDESENEDSSDEGSSDDGSSDEGASGEDRSSAEDSDEGAGEGSVTPAEDGTTEGEEPYEEEGDGDAIWAFLLRDDIELDRIRWELKTGLTGIELPEGYEMITTTFEGEETEAAFHEKKDVTLLYFTDSEEEGRFFLYKEPITDEGETLYPYVTRQGIDGMRNTLLPRRDAGELPEYFSPTLVRIDEMQVAAWKYEGGFGDGEYLLYGVNDEGARSFYRYDTGEEVVELWDPWEMRSLEGPQSNSSENDRERTGIYLTAAVGVLILVVVSVAVYQKQMEKKKKIKGRKKRK